MLRNLSGLENVSNLRVLDLSYNFIESLKGCENLASLDDMNLSHNKIVGLDDLAKNKQLV